MGSLREEMKTENNKQKQRKKSKTKRTLQGRMAGRSLPLKILLVAATTSILELATAQVNTFALTGYVVDSISVMPVHNVNVIVRGELKGTTTDSLGRFRIVLLRGTEHILVFSHIGYHKVTRRAYSQHPGEVEYRIMLVPRSIALGEVLITAKKRFVLTEETTRRASFRIGGEEFERLGEPDMEKAMHYLLPDVVQPLKDRLQLDKNDFTLYVDGEWKESIFLDDLDPFTVRRILVWEGLGRGQDNRHDIFPIGLPLRRGKYVILVETR